MTASRAKLMVRAPIAKSAFPPINSEKKIQSDYKLGTKKVKLRITIMYF